MRLVFMGTPEFALPNLKILLEHKYPVVSVVTAPDKPQGRGQRIAPSPVKAFALERGLPLLQPENLKDPSFISNLRLLQPDLIVVVAFRILPPEVFKIPNKGAFNLHASLLPKYRGAAPINWAIIKGETETGVTTFFLQERVDTGAIILQARVRIGPDETAGELHERLSEVGGEIVLQTVRLIELDKVQPRPQDDTQATPAPKIFKDDCRIRWSKSNTEVHNLVRGLSPTPGAWATHRDTTLKIYRTALVPGGPPPPKRAAGTIASVDQHQLLVRTRDGLLSILDLQQEGRRRMGINEFLRGYEVRVGEKFE